MATPAHNPAGQGQSAFTLVELLVAIAIVGLLMAVTVPGSIRMYESMQYRQAVRDVLTTLPGVGRKTANVVMNCAFGAETFAVDTHIFRVGNRTGIAPGKDVNAVERAIEDHIPAEFQMHAHHWLILHGRYHCKARKPMCGTCIIRDLCEFEDKNL